LTKRQANEARLGAERVMEQRQHAALKLAAICGRDRGGGHVRLRRGLWVGGAGSLCNVRPFPVAPGLMMREKRMSRTQSYAPLHGGVPSTGGGAQPCCSTCSRPSFSAWSRA